MPLYVALEFYNYSALAIRCTEQDKSSEAGNGNLFGEVWILISNFA